MFLSNVVVDPTDFYCIDRNILKNILFGLPQNIIQFKIVYVNVFLQLLHKNMALNIVCSYSDKRRHQTEGSRHVIARLQENPSSKEVWFRAAVITVPIAGGLILVLLIMLALHMLRSENRRLQQQRREMLSRLHYSFHGQHLTKGHVAKLDLECMVPVGVHENCCLTCDKIQQSDLTSQRLLSLVSWGKYSGRGKLEFV